MCFSMLATHQNKCNALKHGNRLLNHNELKMFVKEKHFQLTFSKYNSVLRNVLMKSVLALSTPKWLYIFTDIILSVTLTSADSLQLGTLLFHKGIPLSCPLLNSFLTEPKGKPSHLFIIKHHKCLGCWHNIFYAC